MTTTTITLNPGDAVTVLAPAGGGGGGGGGGGNPPLPGGHYRGELAFDGQRIEAEGCPVGEYVWWGLKIPLDARMGTQSDVYAFTYPSGDQSRTEIVTKTAGDFAVKPPASSTGSGTHIYLVVGQGGTNNVGVMPGETWYVSVKKAVVSSQPLGNFAIRVSALS